MKPIIDFDDQGTRLTETKCMKLINNKHAFHKLGYIGRPESQNTDFIVVSKEKPEYYIGNFIEGLGFVNTHFLKEDCAELSDEDKEFLANSTLEIVPMSQVVFKKNT